MPWAGGNRTVGDRSSLEFGPDLHRLAHRQGSPSVARPGHLLDVDADSPEAPSYAQMLRLMTPWDRMSGSGTVAAQPHRALHRSQNGHITAGTFLS